MQLKIDSLSKRYANGVQALDDVNLTIHSGMFGLLGPNGAGKSTLMRTIATLQDADAGSIRLTMANDVTIDVRTQKEEVRALLGYLPQEFGLYPKVSAVDLLDHLALLKGIAKAGERKDVVHALLKRTNLWDARHRALGTYSGGMKQRFGIAQALLGAPQLIIVDEPTAGLDPEERNRFHNLLADIGDEIIVILSTHIVGDVSDLCKQMAILHKGKVKVLGEPLALVRDLRGKLWRRFVNKADLQAIEREHTVISTRRLAGQTVVHVHAPTAPTGFEAVEPDLEDLYFLAMRDAPATTPTTATTTPTTTTTGTSVGAP